MKQNASAALLNAFRGLRVSPVALARRPALAATIPLPVVSTPTVRTDARPFSSTAPRTSWLEPRIDRRKKKMKGRPRVATGGSTKGTTVVWGDYGLRMWDHHRRVSAKQLKVAEDTIKQRLRGQRYRLYKRVSCNIGVYVSGNEMRMGKGKGSFDHWASRIAVNQILFELRGAIHEQVVRDAFRLAGNKLPGQYEFVKKGDPAVVGITKLDGVTLEELKRPRRQLPTIEEAVSSPLTPSAPDAMPTIEEAVSSPLTPSATDATATSTAPAP